MPTTHLLQQLYLPDRYETLREHLGPDLVNLLVAPPPQVAEIFRAIAQSVQSKRRGLLIPAWADSGTGKSTLANSLHHFYLAEFATPAIHVGQIDDANLIQTCRMALAKLPANEQRVLPIVVDGREGEPPSEKEMAAVKRFLRSSEGGARAVILWLETDGERAKDIAEGYGRLAGPAPVDLPFMVMGPPRDSWPSIAQETLRLSNNIDSLEALGVDPNDYDTDTFRTIGDYLSQIADDFNRAIRELLSEMEKPTQLIVAFASESRDVGPLAQFTGSGGPGLLSAHALVGSTPGTDIGRWWADRMGLLTSTIVRLSARAYVLPPTVTITALRRYGPQSVKQVLDDIADVDAGPYWERSDVGRFIRGEERDAREARGNPGEAKTLAFRSLAEAGMLSGGQDKELNKALGRSLNPVLANLSDGPHDVMVEEKLDAPGAAGVIPDICLESSTTRTCIELTWRHGEYSSAKNRAAMAAYILEKLKGYAQGLGWA